MEAGSLLFGAIENPFERNAEVVQKRGAFALKATVRRFEESNVDTYDTFLSLNRPAALPTERKTGHEVADSKGATPSLGAGRPLKSAGPPFGAG